MNKGELEDMWSYLSRDLSEVIKREVLVPTGRNGAFLARDYVVACCFLTEVKKVVGAIDGFACKADMERVLSPSVRWRMKYYTPCLAARWDELKDDKKSEVLNSIDWVATEKIHGLRAWLIVTRDDKVHLFGRDYDDNDCGLVDYWGAFDWQLGHSDMTYGVDVEVQLDGGCDVSRDLGSVGLSCDGTMDRAEVLEKLLRSDDCKELMVAYRAKYGRELVRLKMILPLYWKGINYVEREIGDALDVYDDALVYGQGLGLPLCGIRRKMGGKDVKEVFANTLISTGGEGVVFYNRRGVYCTSVNRSKDVFVKLKHTLGMDAEVRLDDTIDAWVGGVADGDLVCYVMVNDGGQMYKKPIGYIKPSVGLKASVDGVDLMGKVVELGGKCLGGKCQLIEGLQLIRVRDDKMRNDCVYTKSWLDSQTRQD